MEKTRFKHLSGWLKLAIITAWIEAAIFAGAFIVGFIEGFLSA